MAPTLTATVDAATGSIRLDLNMNGLTPAYPYAAVERSVNGGPYVQVSPPRWFTDSDATAFYNLPISGDVAVWWDMEMPLDVPVSYHTYTLYAGSDAYSNVVTVPSQGSAWIRDICRPSNTLIAPLCPAATCPPTGLVWNGYTASTWASAGARFDRIGYARPTGVSNVRRDQVGLMRVTSLSFADRNAVRNILASGRVLMWQAPAAYGWADAYLDIGDVTERPLSGNLRVAQQLHEMPYAVEDAPLCTPSGIPGYRWKDMCTKYTTWTALEAAGLTWKQILDGAAR